MRKRNIAIGVDPRIPFGRQIMEGVARYGLEKGNWEYAETMGMPYLGWWPQTDWRGDGYIGCSGTTLYRALKRAGIPCVNIASRYPKLPRPSVVTDNRAVGRMAGEHLLSKGLNRFATVFLAGQRFRSLRIQSFCDRIAEAGFPCQRIPVTYTVRNGEAVGRDMTELRHYLDTLNEPAGIFGQEDQLARGVVKTAQEMSLRVPEDLAVLGEGNWPFVSDLLPPPLSSIELGAERIGYQAAALLDRLMNGEDPPAEPIIVPPRGLVQRRSTEVLAVEDETVRDALEYMHGYCREPIQIADVVRRVPINRRALERRFRRILGRSPGEELRRVRIITACQMLVETDMPVYAISRACGFLNRERFNVAFRKETHMPPSQYRRLHGR